MDNKEIALQLTLKAMEENFIEDLGATLENAENISKFFLDVYSAISENDGTAAKNESWQK